AGSLKKPVQLPVIQLLERVGKVSWQHVSRRQFFGAAHDRTGLLGGCQACRSVGAKRLLSACRDWLADDAVSCELVSTPNSLLKGKLTGNFANSGLSSDFRI